MVSRERREAGTQTASGAGREPLEDTGNRVGLKGAGALGRSCRRKHRQARSEAERSSAPGALVVNASVTGRIASAEWTPMTAQNTEHSTDRYVHAWTPQSHIIAIY